MMEGNRETLIISISSITEKRLEREEGNSSTPNMATMPSPSSASASATDSVIGEYKVFLSFKGANTRYGFTDYLYNDLVGVGVRTYRDDNELRVRTYIDDNELRLRSWMLGYLESCSQSVL